MPNHIANHLKIEGEDRIVKFIFDLIEGEKEGQFIDFNKIIPAPAFCYNKDAGSSHEELATELSVPIWTSWNRGNWGTKWNAYNQKRISPNSIRFSTAWGCARKVVEVIATRFPMLKVTLIFASEDSGCNTGILTWVYGSLSEFLPENTSKEAWDLYFLLHPQYQKDYQFIDGNYKYIGE